MTRQWMAVCAIVIVLLGVIAFGVLDGNGQFDPPNPNQCINPVPGAKQVWVPCMSHD